MDIPAKAAVLVLTRVQEAKVNKDEWLTKLKETSGWTGEPNALLQAIPAYEKCFNVFMDILTTQFTDCSKHSPIPADDVKARLITFMDKEYEVFMQFCGPNEIAKAATKVSITVQTADMSFETLKRGHPAIVTILKGNDPCKVFAAL